jgi:small-conductance mechanosensitive channel
VSVDPTPPTAWIASVGETAVSVELRFWHSYADRHVVRSAVTNRALAALAEAGIVMPYPTRQVIVSRPPHAEVSSQPQR